MTDSPPPDRHELVRRANIDSVFVSIAGHAPVTRDEIGIATGLSRPTVGGVVAALIAQGLIRVADMPREGRRSAGRIATRYEVDPQAGLVVGIDVGGRESRAAVADLSGHILAEEEVRTAQQGGPVVVAQLAELARSVTSRAGMAWASVDVVSISAPGVENDDGTIRLADSVPGLDAMPLTVALGETLDRRVVWENDVHAAAIGEYRAGAARGCRSFVFLSVGTGLGMGIVIDGAVIRGGRGAAGGIAYLPIGADPTRAPERRRGAFEVAAAGSGVVQLYRDELGRAGDGRPRRGLTARDVYAAASRGEPAARAAAQRHAELLAQGILVVSAVVDPELVVIGGGIGSNPLLLDPLRRAVDRFVAWPLRIEPSGLGPRAALVGVVHQGLLAMPRIPTAQVSSRLAREDITA